MVICEGSIYDVSREASSMRVFFCLLYTMDGNFNAGILTNKITVLS